jgi:hypothetical protein
VLDAQHLRLAVQPADEVAAVARQHRLDPAVEVRRLAGDERAQVSIRSPVRAETTIECF